MFKVLFISREGTGNRPKAMVLNQANALSRENIRLEIFLVKGKGISAYFRSFKDLRARIKHNPADIYHAHYSLSGILAAMAGCRPLVVSLMGSEGKTWKIEKPVIRFFHKSRWNATIIKTERAKTELGLGNARVIPNGVDLSAFRDIDQAEARKRVGFGEGRHLLFLSDPERTEKNYDLALRAFNLVRNENIELHAIHGVDHELVPFYMYASDVLLLPSKWEGSPNAVKEAMACNLPLVATDVGDVREIIADTEGCFISAENARDFADKIIMALAFRRTKGRSRVGHLDTGLINKKILDLYEQVRLSTGQNI